MDIQLFVVIVVFAVAIFFLFRRLTGYFSGKKTAGCAKCPSNIVNEKVEK